MDDNPHRTPCPRPEFFMDVMKKIGATLAIGWGAGMTLYIFIEAVQEFDPIYFSCEFVGLLGGAVFLVLQIHQNYGIGAETPLHCTRRVFYETWRQVPFMTKRVIVITQQAIRVIFRRTPKET